MNDQPFAVMVTSDSCDLMSAVEIANKARAAGAVVQTPFAHTPTHKQIARAKAIASDVVMIICNDIVTIINVLTDAVTVKTHAEAANILAAMHCRKVGKRFFQVANDNSSLGMAV